MRLGHFHGQTQSHGVLPIPTNLLVFRCQEAGLGVHQRMQRHRPLGHEPEARFLVNLGEGIEQPPGGPALKLRVIGPAPLGKDLWDLLRRAGIHVQ